MENPLITLNERLKGPALLIVLVFIITSPSAHAAPVDDVQASLNQAFILVTKAESSGGDVSGLVASLNQAITLVNAGDADSLAKANSIINEVKANVGRVYATGASKIANQYTVISVTLALLAISGLLIYIYGSRLYWSLWLKAWKNWRAEAT